VEVGLASVCQPKKIKTKINSQGKVIRLALILEVQKINQDGRLLVGKGGKRESNL